MVMPRKYFTPEQAHEARKAGWRASNARRKAKRDAAAIPPAIAAPPLVPLIARVVGDPAPGRSALDRRGERV